MRRLLFSLCSIALILTLMGCSYLGATEDILISSPASLSIIRIETFDQSPEIGAPSVTTVPSAGSSAPDNNPSLSDPDAQQPGISATVTATAPAPFSDSLILNISSKKIHYFDNCSYAARIKAENRMTAASNDEAGLLGQGYTVCSWCAKKRG